ncbi:glycosyl hydrolase [candidate division KSB1 bacterium]|nr:glycosyl hydrolase [candidate division KSB1 bacterium]
MKQTMTLLCLAGALVGLILIFVPETPLGPPINGGEVRREPTPPGHPVNGGESEAEEEQRRMLAPSDWFLQQRTWPRGELNRPAIEQARAQALGLQRRGVRTLDDSWTFAGPTNVGGRVTALAVHPSAPDTVYAGAAIGGVLKSTNGGLNWTTVFEEDFALSIGALAVDPQHATWVWVGTGEANASGDSYGGNGVYLSQDGGRTWQHKGLEATRHIGKLAVDPANSNRVFVAAAGENVGTNPERGVYRTTDGGTSWERVLYLTDSTACIDVAVNPVHADTVYAVMWERVRRPWNRQAGGLTSGIWRSTNGGDTWSELITGLPHTTTVGRGGIAVSPVNPQRLYAVYANDPGSILGTYRSDNAGNSWTTVANPSGSFYSTFGWYFGQVWAHPTNQNTVFVQGVQMFRSTNSGSSWTTRFGDAHVDHHALWINPANANTMIDGHDGGINVSTNGGTSSTMSVDLPITQFYAITSDPQLPQRLYGGTQDNSTPRTLTGAVNDWDVLYGGDGFYCLVDPRDSDVIYAESQYGGLSKSLDGGLSWDYLGSDFDLDRINWNMPVVMSAQDPDVLYVGTYRVWKSVNGGLTWTAISGDLTGGPGPGGLVFGTVTTISASPADAQVVYAGTDDARVWVTTNGGGAWTNISAGLPQLWCTRVAAHPDSGGVVYVTFSGYKYEDYLPHVLRSGDYGGTWADVGAGLPEGPVNDVIVDPDFPNYVYVATDFGIYYTPNWGAEWLPVGTGLPTSSVYDLELTTGTPRYLVAGTHGRSMWRHPVPSSAPAAPTELVMSDDGMLRWQSVAGATSYSVYGAPHVDSTGSLLVAGVLDTVWTDLLFGGRPATYLYFVRAAR